MTGHEFGACDVRSCVSWQHSWTKHSVKFVVESESCSEKKNTMSTRDSELESSVNSLECCSESDSSEEMSVVTVVHGCQPYQDETLAPPSTERR